MSFFSDLFASKAPANPAPVDAGSPMPAAQVLQSLTVPSDDGQVMVAIALNTSRFDAKSLQDDGLTYAQVADRVQAGASSDISTYTVVGQDGSSKVVNGTDLFQAEHDDIGTVNRINTTPASTGTLG